MQRTIGIANYFLTLFLLAGFLLAGLPLQALAFEKILKSPNRRIEVKVLLENGTPIYSIEYDNQDLIHKSQLGFELVGDSALDGNFKVVNHTTKQVSENWEQPWGEKRRIDCRYNELRIELQQQNALARRMDLVFRVFDDGVGFRYEWPEQPNLTKFKIANERTEFSVAGDPSTWWIEAYQDNRYEFLYQQTPLSEAPTVHTPVTLRTKTGVHLSIHEAALTDFASMTLAKSNPTTFKADLVPWSDGVKVLAEAPHASPWRTIQISPDAAGLIESYLILNLNEPCVLEDIDWIEPGKYAGVWWEMHLDTKSWSSGEKHGATTANTKKHIDFAADNRMVGVLVEGWNEGWDGDWYQNGDAFSFTKPYPDFDIKEVADYARQKGVRLIGHHETSGAVENYERQLDDAFKLYQSLGVRAVKTGYVAHGTEILRTDDNGKKHGEWHHGQYMVRHYRKVVEKAAKHQIMLDVHEPIKPTGIRRTYPNMMTREGARGQEYNAWASDGGNPPDHTTIIPFTRMLAGPMDYCPGVVEILFEDERPNNRVNTTLAKQLALYVVLYSPLQMVPDLPENYHRFDGAFQFIRDVPTDWEETLVLNGEIGDYVTIVRQERGGMDWYLGSVTDENARELEVELDFLSPNKQYLAQIYQDTSTTDLSENPTEYEVKELTVDSKTTLPLRLAAGGGVAIRFHLEGSKLDRPKLSAKDKARSSSTDLSR